MAVKNIEVMDTYGIYHNVIVDSISSVRYFFTGFCRVDLGKGEFLDVVGTCEDINELIEHDQGWL